MDILEQRFKAIRFGDVERVKYILNGGIDPSWSDERGTTPQDKASSYNRLAGRTRYVIAALKFKSLYSASSNNFIEIGELYQAA